MSFWKFFTQSPDAEMATSMAWSPSGGRAKACLLGIGLALAPIGYGIFCLLTGHATLPGSRGGRIELYGTQAVVLAIGYIAIGVFFHAHWFWGLHPKLELYSQALKILAAVVFLGSLGSTFFGIVASWG